MENSSNRLVYLDNIRNFLVYNVVFFHAILTVAYPFYFWWPVIRNTSASRFYETGAQVMNIYMMPCLLFIAALFIFSSLEKGTTRGYLKKRFLRLCIPVVIFAFCAGDIPSQILLTRINPASPNYLETFLRFWRSFFDLPVLYINSETTLNVVKFSLHHTWFLTLLFLMTLPVVAFHFFRKRKSMALQEVSRKQEIILGTLVFALVLAVVHTVALLMYGRYGIFESTWTIIGKVIQFRPVQIWMLLALFSFGLYVYKKEWLTRGNIGSWKLWGILAFVCLGLYIPIVHNTYFPIMDQIYKVLESNMLSQSMMFPPALNESQQQAVLFHWHLQPLTCVFLLMFMLSFARRFFNKPNPITAFCSKHSINVYILHFIPVMVLQNFSVNLPGPWLVKTVGIAIVVISACLWLSHRLVYPHPKIAIAFFVILKLAALAAGFTFYYYSLLALIGISFACAVCEAARWYRAGRRSGLAAVSCIE